MKCESTEYAWHEPLACHHAYLVPVVERIIEGLSIPKSASILDVGCGGGYLMELLYRKGFTNVWGFDESSSGITVARQSYKHLESHLEVHSAYQAELPLAFAQRRYDLVLCIEVLEHLYAPQLCLRNIHLWLREGGCCILSVPYHGFIKNLAILLTNKFNFHFNPLWEGGHIKFFTRQTLVRLLGNEGLRPIRFYGAGRTFPLWKSMVVIAQK